MTLDGILLVDKPEGISSAAVVREVKRRLGVKKVGHLGTLDPFATGLLPLCLGEGAKVVPFVNEEDKAYEGTLRLGFATDTLDRTGREVERAPIPEFDDDRLRSLAESFLGEGEQVPPMYSALKKDGVRLYELARKGIEVERAPRKVRVDRFAVRRLDGERVGFEVAGSKGLYVRTLAADLARALGTVGHLERLRRTRFGAYSVDEAVSLDEIEGRGPAAVKSPREAMTGVAEVAVDAALEHRLRAGQQWALRDLPGPRPGEALAKVVGEGGDLVGVLGAEGGVWRLRRIFQPADRKDAR